ncbi:MAG: T9SS type A sorting domain-containing protein [Muribaculaceae bacterium]
MASSLPAYAVYDQLYLIGDPVDWTWDKAIAIPRTSGTTSEDAVYSAEFTVSKGGEFKIAKRTDLGSDQIWDNSNFFMHNDADINSNFTWIIDGAALNKDQKWYCPSAGTYRIIIKPEGSDTYLHLQRIPNSVTLCGPGASMDWKPSFSSYHYFKRVGDEFEKTTVYLTTGSTFKAMIDRAQFGNTDSSSAKTVNSREAFSIAEHSDQYDLAIDATGYYNVYVKPNNDGTLYMYLASATTELKLIGPGVGDSSWDATSSTAVTMTLSGDTYKATGVSFDANIFRPVLDGTKLGNSSSSNVGLNSGVAAVDYEDDNNSLLSTVNGNFNVTATLANAGYHTYPVITISPREVLLDGKVNNKDWGSAKVEPSSFDASTGIYTFKNVVLRGGFKPYIDGSYWGSYSTDQWTETPRAIGEDGYLLYPDRATGYDFTCGSTDAPQVATVQVEIKKDGSAYITLVAPEVKLNGPGVGDSAWAGRSMNYIEGNTFKLNDVAFDGNIFRVWYNDTNWGVDGATAPTTVKIDDSSSKDCSGTESQGNNTLQPEYKGNFNATVYLVVDGERVFPSIVINTHKVTVCGNVNGNAWNTDTAPALSYVSTDADGVSTYQITNAVFSGNYKFRVDDVYYAANSTPGPQVAPNSGWWDQYTDQAYYDFYTANATEPLRANAYYTIALDGTKQFRIAYDSVRLMGSVQEGGAWNDDDFSRAMTYNADTGEYEYKQLTFKEGDTFKVQMGYDNYGLQSVDNQSLKINGEPYVMQRQNDSGHDLSAMTPGTYDVYVKETYDASAGKYVRTVRLVDTSVYLFGDYSGTSSPILYLTYNSATGAYEAKGVQFSAKEGSSYPWFKINVKGQEYGYSGATTLTVNGKDYTTLSKSTGGDGADLLSSQTALCDVSVKVASDGSVSILLTSRATADISAVRMPLTAADFADGKKHYFLVGSRQGAWRLQPEWEFLPQADGSYAIDARLLGMGFVMVAMVDNYRDYVFHTYHGFSAPGAAVKPSAATTFDADLSEIASYTDGLNGLYTDLRYDDINTTSPHNQHGGSWSKLFERTINVYSQEGDAPATTDWRIPGSSRVERMTLTVGSDGMPSHLTMTGMTADKKAVSELKVFTFVGGDIRNNKVTYGTDATTPLDHQPGYSTEGGWSEAWIQYDADARPYTDAYGEYVYHTSFTPAWLSAHPSYFNFGEGSFEYDSNAITFKLDASAKHSEKFGQQQSTVNGATKNERLVTYYDKAANDEQMGRNTRPTTDGINVNDTRTITTDNQVCYVIEDMWIEGFFKIWSGWGGSATNYEREENGTNYTRWNRDNAGHGAINTNRPIGSSITEDMYFTLFEDISAANFAAGFNSGTSTDAIPDSQAPQKRMYFNRVELWYNLEGDFKHTPTAASMVRFVQYPGTPNIWIQRSDRAGDNAHIEYNYNLPLLGDQPEEDYGNVTYYKIERVYIGSDGTEQSRTTVAEASINTPREDFGNLVQNVLDDTTLDTGTYQYVITVKRANSGDQTFSGKSNRVTIYGYAAPVLSATQVTEDASGTTLYSFDVTVSGTAPQAYLGVKVKDENGADTDVDILQHLESYRLTMPASFEYSGYTIEGNPSANKVNNQIWLPRRDASDNYRMPTITFHNVQVPADRALAFSVDLTSSATVWNEQTNVGSASATANMVVPSATITISAPTLVIDDAFNASTVAASGKEVQNVRRGASRETLPLTAANRVSANTQIGRLAVTSSVLTDWAVEYDITLTDRVSGVVTTHRIPAAAIDNSAAPQTGVFDYLNAPTTAASLVNGSDSRLLPESVSAAAGSATYNVASTGQYDYTMTTHYTYASRSAITGDNTPSGSFGVNLGSLPAYGASMIYPMEVYIRANEEQIEWWWDAFNVVQLTQDETIDNVHSVGFILTNGATGSHASLGNVVDCSKANPHDEDRYNVFDQSPSSVHFGSQAIAKMLMPVEMPGVSVEKSCASAPDMQGVVLTTYPVALYNPTLSAIAPSYRAVTTSRALSAVTNSVSNAGSAATALKVVEVPSSLTRGFSDLTLSVADVAMATDLRIYPNPASDVVTISANAEIGLVEIYAANGSLAMVETIDDTCGTINVSALPAGIYLAKVGIIVKRLIVK